MPWWWGCGDKFLSCCSTISRSLHLSSWSNIGDLHIHIPANRKQGPLLPAVTYFRSHTHHFRKCPTDHNLMTRLLLAARRIGKYLSSGQPCVLLKIMGSIIIKEKHRYWGTASSCLCHIIMTAVAVFIWLCLTVTPTNLCWKLTAGTQVIWFDLSTYLIQKILNIFYISSWILPSLFFALFLLIFILVFDKFSLFH